MEPTKFGWRLAIAHEISVVRGKAAEMHLSDTEIFNVRQLLNSVSLFLSEDGEKAQSDQLRAVRDGLRDLCRLLGTDLSDAAMVAVEERLLTNNSKGLINPYWAVIPAEG